MNTSHALPFGKLPPDLLSRLLAQAPISDPRVVLGPGLGLDCAVVDLGGSLLVFKSDPITFASDQIGWYAVQVNANDIATTGATPRWFLATLLMPGGEASAEGVLQIGDQLFAACRELGISVIGGHTEITHGIDRPILLGTLIGEVQREQLVTPRGAQPGDRLLLTKGVPIEAVSLLAREFPALLHKEMSAAEIEQAAGFLYAPGISVVRDAQIACRAGRVTAMHDPTEGGLASALWELAESSGHALMIDPTRIPVPALAERACRAAGVNPLNAIASGALLLTAPADDAHAILQAMHAEGIICAEIGAVENEPPAVFTGKLGARMLLPRPARDEIARLYEEAAR